MKLWTDELEQKALGYPIKSQDKKGKQAKVLVKYFNPYGAGTWLITEAEKQENGDWLLFGYCHIFGWEWGYVFYPNCKARKSMCTGASSDLKEIYIYPKMPQ